MPKYSLTESIGVYVIKVKNYALQSWKQSSEITATVTKSLFVITNLLTLTMCDLVNYVSERS